jgi:acyl-CoA synthetase (AMP-forming)/AMP-acid ligase II
VTRGTLLDLLEGPDPSRVALESVDRAPLAYGALVRQARGAAGLLRDLGVGPNDAAAVVLPNGPEMASLFLSTAVAGISAPLNPAYRREEFGFYLDDLRARVLLIADGLDSPAREVARERGVRIVEVGLPPNAAAGVFSLDGVVPAGSETTVSPSPDATALVLHTSGTTSRPKLVPLSHRNLVASATAVAAALELSPTDRCLNVMPLFHIHGLVAAVLGSVAGGGSVICTPGFLAPRFFSWLKAHEPTWYTAVPTMHQAILSRSGDPKNAAILRGARLRFVRSSSAALPGRVTQELEAALGVPVIEAYGMTEAAHQMTSNLLPPAARKPGSVGRAAGPEIAILDPAGGYLAPGQPGEVAIRGPGITKGYLNNPEANERAFVAGWLRTGDQGVVDDEGYLTLTGRLKEQINRAGEKISPLEVDQVLTDHPAVASALSFAVPHPVLGEDIAAVVVLKPDAAPTERQLREYVAGRLAYFKVPRRILLVDAIPTGATGKLQRVGLAERLGVRAEVPVDDLDATPPRTPVEEIVAAVWTEVMGNPTPGVRRNFFALGGDSILAARMVARIRELLAVNLSLLDLFDSPSVEGLAGVVEGLLGAEASAGQRGAESRV